MSESPLTDAEFVVLSLICEQPLHGYEIENQIKLRNMRAWTDLATSSIYYLLGKLEEKGLILPLPREAESSNDRPRKVFQASPEGIAAWKETTLGVLRRPRTTYTNFLMGLHNLWSISPTEARQAVTSYRDWLVNDLNRQREELERLGMPFFPLDVLFDYSFILGDAELEFLDMLINRLEEIKKDE
jgi:DNA-binding PadR family transcriptional regulator